MNSQKSSPAAAMFEKVLRAFETRGITYSDVLARLRRLLATDASPTELLAILRRRESAERMPEYARLEALLIEAVEQSTTRDEESEPPQPRDPFITDSRGSAPAASSVTSLPNPSSGTAAGPQRPEDELALDFEFDAPAKALNMPRGLRASELDLSVLARHLRSVEERTPPRGAALEALTRSFEKAREGESAAAERAAALAADLASAGAELQAEQGKLRTVEQALAQSVAAGETARETALRELQQYQTELLTLRDSLAERDAALDRIRQTIAERDAALDRSRQAISERDARLAALSRERAALESALEARTKAAAELAAAARAAPTRAQVTPAPAAAIVENRREEARKEVAAPAAWAPPSASAPSASTAPASASAPTASAPPVSAPAPSPELGRRPRRVGGAARAIGWSAAALLLAGFAWLFAHRSPPQPATPPTVAAPDPGSVIHDCASCPEMTVLPAGRFKQGSARGPAFEQPLHWVVIGRSIAMSTSPVTVQDFEQFVADTGRDMQGCDTYDGEWKHRATDSWQHPGFAQTEAHPVTCVSWSDAKAYANWLSTKTGHRYRLPSASEWEYAARAGAEMSPVWGPDGQGACADANVADASAGRRYPGWVVFPCDDGYVNTAPVGTFKANPFGLADMMGNVLQWTEDCWHESYAGAPIDGSAWVDGDCSAHELRGASWFSTPSYARTDYRDHFPADYRTSSVGIRLVRDVGP
jgi:formylglycine-generating enzyme required for sulfatase activity/predicted  nucleic acid-binding Zn-ribbon protein